MTGTHDLVVVGLGAAGSATLLAAARAGARAVGIDALRPPHDRGSTHGDTRITRLAVGEGTAYVPFAVRSHELWRQLESETGEDLLTQCGGIVLSAPGGRGQHGADDFLQATVEAAATHGIPLEVLDAAALARCAPAFALRGDERGVLEPTAGFVRPERAVAASLRRAGELGADLRLGTRVRAVGGGRVELVGGEVLRAERIVVAAGPWVAELLPEMAERVEVTRQVLHWFDVEPGRFEEHRDLPVFIWITGDGPSEFFYGFPAIDGPDGGLKVATEQFTRTTSPDAIERTVPANESAAMHARSLAGRLPGLRPRAVRAVTCLYTSTPDASFLLGERAGDPTVLVASACSGHGFKHSAAVGESLAQRALLGESAIDLAPFAFA